MVPKANAVYMSLFILLLLFSSKVVFARVSQFSETKEKIDAEFSKMKIVDHIDEAKDQIYVPPDYGTR
ncbi:hypothetical protein ACE6H2_010648 [Prunus campanulata]